MASSESHAASGHAGAADQMARCACAQMRMPCHPCKRQARRCEAAEVSPAIEAGRARGQTPMTVLKWIVILAAIGYLGALAALFFAQRSLMFPIPTRVRTTPVAAGL